MADAADTIFALSSGRPPAAVAVVRISGARAGDVLAALAEALPEPRRASLQTLRGHDGIELDRGLVLWFPGTATATGEPLAELQLHGGRATIEAVLAALGGMDGLRAAEPGEFTRRALRNGRIDLTQAEGLADLLAAETETQRRAALSVAEGAVARSFQEWHRRLLEIAALIEAQLDFDDEADVALSADVASERIATLAGDIDRVLATPPVERLHQGVSVVLAGPPNAGKSSLFNALVERDAAIVTPIAGTTRDVIEAHVVRAGIAYRLIDTAGLRDSDDAIETIGIERARASADVSDIVLWMGDGSSPDANWIELNPKCDDPLRGAASTPRLSVSVERPETVSQLWTLIELKARALLPSDSSTALNERQRDAARHIADHLRRASETPDLLLQAEEIRTAGVAVSAATGRHHVEGVLDALFSRFCIGK